MQMDATLLRYALAITEQKKGWELLASNFDPFQALCNNCQQHKTTCNTGCSNGCNMYSDLQKCSICLHGALDDKVVVTVKTDYIIRGSVDVHPHWPLCPVQGQMG